MILDQAIFAARFARRKLRELKRRVKAPDIPKGNHVLVHLGCGEVQIPGAINVDGQWLPHIHHVADVRSLSMLPTNTVDEIYACHVLEHLGFNETKPALGEWLRVLKPGGQVRISVPDFDHLIAIYQAENRSILSISPALLGGQEEHHNFHHTIFNREWLTECLEQAGFERVEPWDPKETDPRSDDWAGRPYRTNGTDYPLSLNLRAFKPRP